ncbi:hypothetical protein AWB80_02885 [Caballeronia pedi]|uniref:Phage protein, HK97 gp10 family n=2 Tax=Caballeronia pedi TaxID=1777141 RepID=A0A158B0J2_9BURK|nr:hypothetical protein AWB80_02885 [Caballeronia pedi]
MMSISAVKGLKELDEFLATLPEEVQKSMLTSSLRVAAKPILDQAMLNVLMNFGGHPRSSGVLFSHITRGKVKRTGYAARIDVKLKRRSKSPGKVNARINGVRKPYGDDPFYGRFLEFGTSKMEAKPWLRPAAIAKQDDAGRGLNVELQRRMALWCKKNGVKFVPSL